MIHGRPFHSDPEQTSGEPDCETLCLELEDDACTDQLGNYEPGWYWQLRGDTDWVGPFPTETDAIHDATYVPAEERLSQAHN